MSEVKLENVIKAYDTKRVIDGVDLTIKDKEFMVLVGSSGCGKSTILRMIAGLEEISGGNIYIGDKKVNNVHPKDRDIAMVFQNYALYPHMTVFDNMAFGLKLRKTSKDEIETINATIIEINYVLERPIDNEEKINTVKELYETCYNIFAKTEYFDIKQGLDDIVNKLKFVLLIKIPHF